MGGSWPGVRPQRMWLQPQRGDTVGSGAAPGSALLRDKGSLWLGQGGFGAETPTYSLHPFPSPQGSSRKDDLMGILSLIFAL